MTSLNSQMLWYLLTMMMYPAWKISSDSEEDVNDTEHWNHLWCAVDWGCLWIVAPMCNLDIHYTSFKPYLKLLHKQLKTVPEMLLKRNTVPVAMTLYILETFRRTLFQWQWYWTLWEEHYSSDMAAVHFWIFKEHWKLFQCRTLIPCIANCSRTNLSAVQNID